jgi:hypothetical protein
VQAAIDQFRANVLRVRHLLVLHNQLAAANPGQDVSDILRSQIVMVVSALDHYIHEIARLGMIETYQGHRLETDSFRRFEVSLAGTMQGAVAGAGSAWLESEIREAHSLKTFQQPDKVADAVRLISDAQLWRALSAQFGQPVPLLKNRLSLIVRRRNQIAHEADLDPTYPGVRWPINPADVMNATDFIDQLCEAIHVIVV